MLGLGLCGTGGLLVLIGRSALGFGLIGLGLAYLSRLIPSLRKTKIPRDHLTWLRPLPLDSPTGPWHDVDVIRGRFSGTKLSKLNRDQLAALRDELTNAPYDRSLLDAYIDGSSPRWGRDSKGDGTSAGGLQGSAVMTREEAYQILGLEAGASELEVRQAHRRLIKTLHPDAGGTNFLAAQVNTAKDVLLK